MFKIIVMSAEGCPSFLLDSSLDRFQISREVSRRFGYATTAPFASSTWALPHSWMAVAPV